MSARITFICVFVFVNPVSGIYIYIYIYPSPRAVCDRTSIFKQKLTAFNQKFSLLKIHFNTKIKDLSPPNYLTMTDWRIVDTAIWMHNMDAK